MNYLYGASVQGIQDFIFQTKSLAEIVGASELVEEICTTRFVKLIRPEYSGSYHAARQFLKDDPNAVLNAAGNIKYVFGSKTDCERVVREFPRMISEFAPGITISQAVVEMKDGVPFEDVVSTLEERLKVQRNRPSRSAVLGLMGIQRSRQTGLPVVSSGDGLYLDKATAAKLYTSEGGVRRKMTTYNLCRKAFGVKELDEKKVAFNIGDITSSNDWIAVIHADGNGLGNVVHKVGHSYKDFKDFSCKLDEATINAAVKAYQCLDVNKDKVIPVRPIVLGGDDLTVICRGDLALRYTAEFIKEFEKETERLLGGILSKHGVYTEGAVRNRLTACAGIAFIKSSFPFHYGYSLAEELCKAAKTDAKSDISVRQGHALPQSCIMFHKVQGSYTGSYDEIVRRELFPQKNLSFCFGPYYLAPEKNRWTIDELIQYSELLSQDRYKAVRSRIRNWMTLVFENEEMANQDLDRIKSINVGLCRDIEKITGWTERSFNSETLSYCPAYDVLAVNTINTLVTTQKR